MRQFLRTRQLDVNRPGVARRLFERLGGVAVVAVGVVVVGSLVAYHAEHPVNPEFATVGDALW